MQFAASASALAQAEDTSPLVRASSLSESRQFAAVVSLLEPYVREHPSSAEAWLLLAQHQYWSGDISAARRTYLKSIQHHPADTQLRLSFARYLMENGEAYTAKEVLRPLGTTDADAEAIRGTIAWWQGELTKAARHFRSALETNPKQAEASVGLAAIRAGARPWIRVIGERASDSQPLDRAGAVAEVGFFLTPLQTLRTEIRHVRIATDEEIEPITFASAEAQSVWPSVHLESEVGAGVISRTDSADWTARLETAFRLPYGLRLGGRAERAPYLYTVASIAQSVMTVETQIELSLDRQGWLGEMAFGRTTFPDKNVQAAAYGWLMAPFYRSNMVSLQGGYAFSYQNTSEHRFTPVMTTAPRPGQPPQWEGRYIPYYTPLNVRTHGVTGSVSVRSARILTLSLNGSYGFAGKEDAPFVYLVGTAPATGVYEHSIHPWNLRGRLSAEVSGALTVSVEGSHMATTWYDASVLSLSMYVRF